MNTEFKVEQSRNLFAAAQYVRKEWKVVPIHTVVNGKCSCGDKNCSSIAKHPLNRNGVKGALSSANDVFDMWMRRPDANIALATGEHFFVVDIDLKSGGIESWNKFSSKFKTPKTLCCKTGGGGKHLYFKSSGKKIANRVSVLPGIDIRGVGGYVLAPPSLHHSGETYSWCDESPTEIAEAPKEILDLCEKRIKLKANSHELIKNGTRNEMLCSVAGLFRKKGF